MAQQNRLPLGELLLQKGIITADQLRIALVEQRNSGQQLGKMLVSLGFVTEGTMREALSEKLGQGQVDLATTVIDGSAIRLVSKELAKRHTMLPIAWRAEERKLILAMANPSDLAALDQLRRTLRDDVHIEPVLAAESELQRAIDQYYGFELSIDGILHEIETGEVDYQVTQTTGAAEYSQPVVRLIDALLSDAVQRGASDIHFEPEISFIRIRYRIDGVLRQIRSLHKTYWPAMVVRLKVIGNMNIAENRAPQDGRISLTLAGRPVDFRVAAQPTTNGENIVLRVLDRQKGLVPLEQAGLQEDNLALLKLMIARPEGIILVTGPTGSGKTTTLYSILGFVSNEGVNVMTLEDPVEYPMPLIRQTSVNEAAKMDFAGGIRSMMRQDPDIILIGEIRDHETAEMAFRAAMTGHQVFSTLHTNSALGAVPRLLDIGILPDIMAGNIIGIVAQRLVRRLCAHCKSPYEATDLERRILGTPASATAPTLYKSVGCAVCEYHGYRGRIAVMEILKLNAELDELISRRASLRELRDAAKRSGFKTLADDALRRVVMGDTALEEVARVVDLTDRIDWV